MKKGVYLLALVVCLAVFSSCRNSDRQVRLIMDEWAGPGEFKGYATVYKYDMFEDEYVRESSGNPVYEVEEGYCIEWDGDTWTLEKLDTPIDPFGGGITKLRYSSNLNLEVVPDTELG